MSNATFRIKDDDIRRWSLVNDWLEARPISFSEISIDNSAYDFQPEGLYVYGLWSVLVPRAVFATPAWGPANQEAAQREGWDVFTSGDLPRVERIDEVTLLRFKWVPQLQSDQHAWYTVMRGGRPHHRAARELIATENPEHWTELQNFMLGED